MKAAWQRHLWVVPIEIAMLVGAVLTFTDHNWVHFWTSIFTCLACLSLLVLERILRIKLTPAIQVIVSGFIFLSMFCGEVLFLYRDISWWDAAAHGLSGVLIALGFLLWIRRLGRSGRTHFSAWYQTFFVIACGMMAATVWELVEFGADQLFGANSQDGSLFDTMTDLLYGTTGTIVLAFMYEFHERVRPLPPIRRLIADFETLNAS